MYLNFYASEDQSRLDVRDAGGQGEGSTERQAAKYKHGVCAMKDKTFVQRESSLFWIQQNGRTTTKRIEDLHRDDGDYSFRSCGFGNVLLFIQGSQMKYMELDGTTRRLDYPELTESARLFQFCSRVGFTTNGRIFKVEPDLSCTEILLPAPVASMLFCGAGLVVFASVSLFDEEQSCFALDLCSWRAWAFSEPSYRQLLDYRIDRLTVESPYGWALNNAVMKAIFKDAPARLEEFAAARA